MHLAFHDAPPPAPIATPVPPTPFTLTAGKDDTGLFKDARATFSHLLPGRPVLGLPAKQGEPPADVVIHLQDAPITIRYSFAPPAFSVPNAADAARLTAESYSGWRAQTKTHVEFANPTWLTAWGVEAAAVATYDVAGGELRDDLFVLARQGYVLTVAWTYPRGFVDDPAYATFASVAEATMTWDPQRWEQRGRVWPESEICGAGLFARPKSKHTEAARRVSAAILPPDERAHLLAILSSIVSGAGAPWVQLAPQVIDGNRRSLFTAARSPVVRAFLEDAFADVRTAHDLRGLAVMLGRAVDGQVAGVTSSAPPPPPAAPILRA